MSKICPSCGKGVFSLKDHVVGVVGGEDVYNCDGWLDDDEVVLV